MFMSTDLLILISLIMSGKFNINFINHSETSKITANPYYTGFKIVRHAY